MLQIFTPIPCCYRNAVADMFFMITHALLLWKHSHILKQLLTSRGNSLVRTISSLIKPIRSSNNSVLQFSPAAKSHKKPRNRCTFNSLGRKFLWSAKVRVGTGVLRTAGSPGGCGPFFQKSSSIDGGLKQGFYMFCPSSKSTFCVYE